MQKRATFLGAVALSRVFGQLQAQTADTVIATVGDADAGEMIIARRTAAAIRSIPC